MSEEIAQVRDASIIAAEIETIKQQTQRMMLTASVEIGRRLVEVKDLVPHGQWTDWLKTKVNYSQSTADNLMKIYREYGDEQISLSGSSKSQTFGNLSYSQAVALFALPADERAEFVETNNVEDMTSRQLKDAIEQAKQAQAEEERLKNQLDGTEKKLQLANESKDKLQQALKKSDDDRIASAAKTGEEIKKLREELAAINDAEPAPPSPEQLKKLRAEVRKEIEEKFKKKEDQLTMEKKTVEEKASEVEKAYKEKLKQMKLDNESILARQQAAEKKLALSAPEAQKCDAYLTTIQQNFQNATAVIELLEKSNPEKAKSLREGLRKILEMLLQQVNA